MQGPLTGVGNSWTTLTATCPTGSTVVGGGWNTSSTSSVFYEVRSNYPTSDTVWSVSMRNSANSSVIQFNAYARCLTTN